MKQPLTETPLRAIRKKTKKTLREVSIGTGIEQGNLSRIETLKQSPTPELAEKLSKYYKGKISEVQILYPLRYMAKSAA